VIPARAQVEGLAAGHLLAPEPPSWTDQLPLCPTAVARAATHGASAQALLTVTHHPSTIPVDGERAR
jgi:hypothetical protein